jgi:hypothetical protein
MPFLEMEKSGSPITWNGTIFIQMESKPPETAFCDWPI